MSDDVYRLPEQKPFGLYALIIGGIGLAACAAGWIMDAKQFFHSYLTAFVFWASISLGGLFFTLLHHLVGATWSVVLRRISETVMAVLPLMVVFFIPIIFGLHTLYHWSHPEAVAGDAILQKKAGYLNEPFFLIRTLIYFLIWSVFGAILYRMSVKQDTGNTGVNGKMRSISAPGMILFALSITYASFDWLMSLDPHWYSTIFGAYYFAGSFLGAVSFFVLIAYYLRTKNILHDKITEEHYHDLGKWMFGFTIFWAYMAFSQFFLIWYANIPEETAFYLHRWEGSWQTMSLILLFGQFVFPFFLLMIRAAKRNPRYLAGVAVFVLIMHWIDMYWLVLPNLLKTGFQFSWMDPACLMGIGGIFVWYFWFRLKRHPIVPVMDPKLDQSINIKN